MERRLGRGLGSLLGQNEAERAAAPLEGAAAGQELSLKSIRPNPAQPRKNFDSEALEELQQSIAAHGVLQPILVRPQGPGTYEIVSGERRWRAARLAGLSTIPAVVRAVDDRTSLELAIVENVQRQDLDPIEKAKGFQLLIDSFGLSQAEVAERVGLQRPTVANFLRLLDLPKEIQDGVTAGLVSMGHARALLGLQDSAAARATFERIVREELNVREAEKLVRETAEAAVEGKAAGTTEPAPAAPKKAHGREAWVGTLETRMREHLGARVELLKGKGYRGRVVVHFNGREDLERISDLLGPKDLL